MLTVLSPAKKLSKDCFVKTDRFHKPQFLDESKALVGKMKKMTPTEIDLIADPKIVISP